MKTSNNWTVDICSVYEESKDTVDKLKSGEINQTDWLVEQVKKGEIYILQFWEEAIGGEEIDNGNYNYLP